VSNNQVVINQDYLRQLQTEYTGDVDEIDQFNGKVYKHGTLPDTNVDITRPFVMRMGGAGFAEAIDMVGMIDGTRSGVAARFKSARGEIYTLEYGIKFLLADSDAVEQLSTLTAQQFEYFMPQTTGT
jgi:hypothetical protein